jgi:3-methylcrotonyl-CoA carboxylase alpha subunit
MTPERRAEMGAAAVAAAKAVNYVGAGTVEFIAEQRDNGDLHFYFMEMNTRLQVEHPVTEAITGVDLVEWQLRVAAGQPLPLQQHELRMHGHAIEARICAENPDANFLPATGTLHVARWPEHAAFERSQHLPRVDSGVREGDTISPHYDSMIAKLIVWGEDREQALARLSAALRRTHIMGLNTNVAFLGRVLGTRAFLSADLDTALIERERVALFEAPALPAEVAAAGVAALRLAQDTSQQDHDPWSRRDGWRLHGGAQRRLTLQLLDAQNHATPLQVKLHRLHDGVTRLEVKLGEGTAQQWPLRTQSRGEGQFDVHLGDSRLTLDVYAYGERFMVFADAGMAQLLEVDPLAHAGDQAGSGGRLTAPMPGKVVQLLARVGEHVKRGQTLAVMEAMKMEHSLNAPHDGVVQELLYAVGDQVLEGGELLRLSAAPA